MGLAEVLFGILLGLVFDLSVWVVLLIIPFIGRFLKSITDLMVLPITVLFSASYVNAIVSGKPIMKTFKYSFNNSKVISNEPCVSTIGHVVNSCG